jgi:hypothetical protein
MRRIRIFFTVIAAASTTLSSGSDAQDLGIGRVLRQIPTPSVPRIENIPRKVLRDMPGGPAFTADKLRKSLGVMAVVAVGVAILGKLTEAERRQVSSRVQKIVRADPDREAVDVYKSNKGKRKVTIKASPAQPKPAFKDDPALKPEPDDNKTPAKDDGGKGDKPKDAKDDVQVVFYDDVPDGARCRRVETQIADANTAKSDAPDVATNLAVVCELSENDWRPVKARQVAETR